MVDLGSLQVIIGGGLAGLGEARMSSGLMPGAVALDAGRNVGDAEESGLADD